MKVTVSNCNKARGMKVVRVNNQNRGMLVTKSVPCEQTIKEFVEKLNIPTSKLNAYLNKILENNTGGNINNNETVYRKVFEVYKKRTEQINSNYKSIGGGPSPFVGAYYVDGHGMCSFPNKKFTVPKDKVVIFMAKATTVLGVNQTNKVEKNYLRTKQGVERFIKGSARENGMNNADFAARAHIEGESIFDQWVVFPRQAPNNRLVPVKLGITNVFAPALGPSSGHVWRLPLRTSHHRNAPFAQNNIRRVLNLSMFGTNYKKNRFGKAFMLSELIKNGPLGVYIVATCREILGKHAALHRPGNRTVITNVISANNNNTRNLLAQNIRRHLIAEARKRRAAKKS